MHQIFKSTFFNFEFMRILSMAPFGGADVAECLVAAGKTRDLDARSWNEAWHEQATKAEGLAHEARQNGDVESARRAYMRSANYFRAAGYLLNGRTPGSAERQQAREYGERAATNFARGAALLPGRVLPLAIPYHDGGDDDDDDGVVLPGYLYLPPEHARLPGRPTPLIIVAGGADSTQEELYWMNSLAPASGYALLTFEGPGQGLVLRRHGLTMRPDFEAVVAVVLDFLAGPFARAHPKIGLDYDRVALAGASMGGYFALRGAADTRIAACVAVDPFYDMWDFATHHTSPWLLGLWEAGWVSTAAMDGLLGAAARLVPQLRWELGLTQWLFGAASPAAALQAMKRYSLRGGRLARVRCPVLVSSAGQSLYLAPSTDARRILADLGHLPAPKKRVWVAAEPEDGGLQAKVGAFSLYAQRMIQFLDEHFGVERPVLMDAAEAREATEGQCGL